MAAPRRNATIRFIGKVPADVRLAVLQFADGQEQLTVGPEDTDPIGELLTPTIFLEEFGERAPGRDERPSLGFADQGEGVWTLISKPRGVRSDTEWQLTLNAASWELEDRVVEWLDSMTGPDLEEAETGLTVEEHRQLEVVIAAVDLVLENGTVPQESVPLVQAASETIHSQVKSGHPDRVIIGRSLRAVAKGAGVVIAGVAAAYLTSLLQSFGVPWPR